MLNIKPPDYKFCPMCGSKLSIRTSEGKDQKYCENCKWIYYPHVVSSVGAIILKNNKVLMVKRNIEPYRDTWMFPSGFINYGEHPRESIRREVKEETSLNVISADLIAVEQAVDDVREPGHFYYLFNVTIEDGDAVTDGEENKDIAWISLQDDPKIGWEISKRYFMKLKKKEIL